MKPSIVSNIIITFKNISSNTWNIKLLKPINVIIKFRPFFIKVKLQLICVEFHTNKLNYNDNDFENICLKFPPPPLPPQKKIKKKN
jgi:hypothetical protein